MFCAEANVAICSPSPRLRDDRDLPSMSGTHHSRPRRARSTTLTKPRQFGPRHDVEIVTLDELALHARAMTADLMKPDASTTAECQRRRVGKRAGKPVRPDEHEREVDRLADLTATRHGLPAVHDAAVSVHKMERPVEADLVEVDERARGPTRSIGRADDRDAPRCEERPQPLGARRLHRFNYCPVHSGFRFWANAFGPST
jgi:hypothetical protein